MGVTENHGAIACGLAGILLGLLWPRGRAATLRGRSGRAAAAILALTLAATGLRIGWARTVQDPIAGRPIGPPLGIEGARHLRWQRPAGSPLDVSAAEFTGLVERLRREGRPFFVWPDHTILYGLCGAVPPQPILWFHRGLTYPAGGDPALEARLLDGLDRHGVDLVVYETETWHGTQVRLDDFPELRGRLNEAFRETGRFGLFRILERVERPGPFP